MIIIWGCVEAKEDKREQVLALARAHVERSRVEPGCLRHDAHIHLDNPNQVVFYEQWRNLQSVQDHFALQASREFMQTIATMAATPPEIRLFDATEIPIPSD